jgi:hypothetical protein
VEQENWFSEGWWSKKIGFLKVGGASKWGLWSKQLGLLKVGGASKLVF